MTWTIEYFDLDDFGKFLDSLKAPASNDAVKDHLFLLSAYGLNLLATNKMKSLGGGLFELRVRKPPELLVRIFVTMLHPRRLVVLSAYNKLSDNSDLRQRREIKKARKIIDALNGRQ